MKIQPGPARMVAAHQRPRLAAVFSGRKRRKSTCSPICATMEKAMVQAVPNVSQSNRPSAGPLPRKPGSAGSEAAAGGGFVSWTDAN
jgi:hypothetical protein